jgi:Uncharacterized conserved protein (some members contain a von Willebrand factor type A (vWA) domain)
MKDLAAAPPKRRLKFIPCGNFWLYLALLVSSLVFTQALRSPVSAVLYVFFLLLPIFTLMYLFAASAGVKVYVERGSSQTPKRAPVRFGLTVANDTAIPVPFAEIDVMLPSERAVRCVGRRVRVSLAPFGYYDLSETVTFPYRGEYEIGVSDIYIYDLFRMFRLRVTADTFTTVFVIPRRLSIDRDGAHAASDVNTSSVKNINGVDRAELADIREYRSGDHMKSIHWNLSSKTQDLVVKEYAMNSGNRVYVFADTARLADPSSDTAYEDDINEYAADGVIELALAAATRELEGGNDVTMVWYDDRYDGGMQTAELESVKDLDRVFPVFATVKLCPGDGEHDFTKMSALVTETQGVTIIFVSARMDAALVRGISAAAGVFGGLTSRGAVGYIYFDPSDHISSDEAITAYRGTSELCRRQLVESGIMVTSPRL